MLFCKVVKIVKGFIVEFGLNVLVIVWLCINFGLNFEWLLGLKDGVFVIVKILFVCIFINIVVFEMVLFFFIVFLILW